jgi:predicted RNA-binding protein
VYKRQTDSFTYTISDGNGGTATASVTVTVNAADEVNNAPVANADTASVAEDGTVLVDVLGNDSDADGDIISITLFTQGSHGTVIEEVYGLRYTPEADYNGADSFTYTIGDGNGGTAAASVGVTVSSVNDAPVAVNDAAVLNEDSTVLIDVLANDSDIDGDSLAIILFSQGAHGTVVQEGGSMRYTPAATYNGTDSFTYTISDDNGGTAAGTVNITVNSVNDVPEAVNDNVTVNEDSTVLVDVLVNDTDADGDILSITGFTQGSHGTVAQEGSRLRYTPA